MAKVVYPLLQILQIKEKRVEEAEKVVKEKLAILEQEKEKLKKRQAERDKVLHHHDDKLAQMRAELDHITTSPIIQQMRAYLKVVKEKLKVEEKKVKDQQGLVEVAEKNVELARAELARKRQEVDKLQIHRKDWLKHALREQELQDDREMDEMGGVMFGINQKKRA